MAIYYPQGAITLKVLLEDFGAKSKARLQDVHEFTAIAKTITVNLNSYREADTFNCVLDFKNFPFDPRAIRSAAVTIHVEDKKYLFDPKQGTGFPTFENLNLIKPKQENIIFLGYADTDKIDLSEDNRLVTLEGRDFTSLLLDRPYLGKPIALSKPLDLVFQGLLNELDETRFDGINHQGIEVVNETGEALPVLAKFDESITPKKKGSKNARPNRSYWDMIQKITNQAGLITYMSLDKLIITKPRNLYSDQKPKLFIYGENVSEINFERKLGRMKGINIRVLSLNFKEKKVIEARIPKEATEVWAKDIGVKIAEVTTPQVNANGERVKEEKPAPYLTFKVKNVKTKAELIKIGESIYEEVGRQQIEGSLTTKEMLVCEDTAAQDPFKATSMRVGTPIEIDINQGDLKGMPDLQVATNKGSKLTQIKQFLVSRCYEDKIAEAFAEALVNFDTPFFTQEVEFKLDQESGWQMKVNFVNFINLPRNLTGAK